MTRLADPIAMEVFSNRLLSITEDMGSTLIRSSFSTNIKERKDCSVGLFDATGGLIAQASHIPLHLGSLLGSVQAVLARYDVTRMNDGDAFVLNDPYLAGGTHMPDISIVTPVFNRWRGARLCRQCRTSFRCRRPGPGFDLRPCALDLRGRSASAGDTSGARRHAGRGPAGTDRTQLARSR
jgi:hypothetical protein